MALLEKNQSGTVVSEKPVSPATSSTDTAGKEKRFVAANMMQAMRLLTDEFGADAILLSSRSIAAGVEVIGLPPGAKPSHDDFSRFHSDRRQGERRGSGRRASDQSPATKAESPKSVSADESRAAKPGATLAGIKLRQTAADLAKQIDQLNNKQSSVRGSTNIKEEAPAGESVLSAKVEEKLANMQQMLEKTLVSNGAGQSMILPPHDYIVSNRLHELRFSQKLVNQLLTGVAPASERGSLETGELWSRVIGRLKATLPVYQHDLLEAGGVYAFIGSAGVGKTALVLKLMTQAALKGQSDEVALITFDNNNSGVSPARLQRLASVSRMTVLAVSDQNSLQDCIARCADKRLLLIDTSGAQATKGRPAYLHALHELESAPPIREIICLSATADRAYQKAVLERYTSQRSVACALTHCDQMEPGGELLSLLVEQQLPLVFLSTGESLPQQLSTPDPDSIVSQLCGGAPTGSQSFRDVMMPIVNMPVDENSVNVQR